MAGYELGEKNIRGSSIAVVGFLEISGECEPLVSPDEQNIEEVKERKKISSLSAYNYRWTLGITGETANWINGLSNEDNAILVQFLFNTHQTGYRVRELATTIRQLAPLRDKPKLSDVFNKILRTAKPLIGGAGELIGGPAKIIASAVSQLQIDSVSPEEFKWYVKSFTSFNHEQGIEWCLSKKLFENLGNRISGGVAVLFHRYLLPGKEEKKKKKIILEAWVCLQSAKKNICNWVPPMAEDGKHITRPLFLEINPK